ncbi:MAG: M48 family metalloprotease [Candidatus Eisenbacteria sp.]|nr:M48 family metalloprotease [Candidatus Eisenbacteria bacterium]
MRRFGRFVWSVFYPWVAVGLVCVALILGAMELTGCAGVSRTIGQINLISTAEEVEMGRKFSIEIEKQLEILDDAEVTAYVNSVCQNLVRHCGRQDIGYRVKVVRSEEINAFAVMGGFMYFNVGLLRAAGTEAELAGVCGHEIGHIVGRHSAKHISKQLGLAMVAQLVIGENPRMWESLVANVLSMGAMMHYSREAEREADAYAIEEMVGAEYHPEGLVIFFEKIRDLQKRTPGAVERFFATHPPTEERLATARATVAEVQGLSRLRKDSLDFCRMKEHLPEVLPDQDGEESQG